jgi:hypothetical protein
MNKSDDKKPLRRYAGKHIGDLRGPRSPVRLPSLDDATLLPDPRAAYNELLDRFRAVNGPKDAPTAFPNMSGRDVRAFANVITFALRNDLPSLDDHDAAVIWDKWRQVIDDVRDHLKRVRDDSLTNEHSADVWNACIVLDHRGWDLRESLVVSLANPGEVFRHYCPWRSEWATYERIYPRAS